MPRVPNRASRKRLAADVEAAAVSLRHLLDGVHQHRGSVVALQMIGGDRRLTVAPLVFVQERPAASCAVVGPERYMPSEAGSVCEMKSELKKTVRTHQDHVFQSSQGGIVGDGGTVHAYTG